MAFPLSPTNGQTHTEGSTTYTFVAASNAWLISGTTSSSAPTSEIGEGTSLPAVPGTIELFRLINSTNPALSPDGLYYWNGSSWSQAGSAAVVESFEFTQAVPSVTWTINHNLGRRPGGVTLRDASGLPLFADQISNPTVNQTNVTFLVAQAGSATLS